MGLLAHSFDSPHYNNVVGNNTYISLAETGLLLCRVENLEEVSLLLYAQRVIRMAWKPTFVKLEHGLKNGYLYINKNKN